MRYDHFTMLPEKAFFSSLGRLKTLEGGGKGSSPPPPDYAGAATATAQGNLDATRAASAANRINQYTPYGNLTYTHDTVKNADGTVNPDAGWNQSISLSDTGQKLLDAQNNSSLGLSGLQQGALDNVQNTMGRPMSTANVPAIQSGVVPGKIQTDLNTNGVQAIPTVDQGYRNQIQNATYNEQAQYLDPQWQQKKESFDAQMANQGLTPGSQAYDAASKNFSNAQQSAYSDARNQAITQGNSAMQDYFNIGLAGNQAGMQNAMDIGNFHNQAQGQDFNQRLASTEQTNAAAQQQLEQNAYLYNQPLNTLNAIRTGSQVSNPNFSPIPQQQTTTGPDMLGAAQATGNYNIGASNAANAANNNFTSGLFSLGSAALMASDRRLKKNIRKISVREDGLPEYEFEYIDGFGLPSGKQTGMMADEVEKIYPHAVITHVSGYKMVNYGVI